jgi:two-component system chemotaxis response regulator CheB
LRRGPHENSARPAVDPLFRSAAASFGGRVIGVVLSGGLDDGTAGLDAIKRCGGIAVVQDPAEATVPDMPRSAIRHVAVDYIAKTAGIADLLAGLAGEAAGQTPEIPIDVRIEAGIAAQEPGTMAKEEEIGTLSPFSCPECGGTLWEIADRNVHDFTAQSMLAAQADEVEQLVGGLLRSHEERAALARRMAEQQMEQNRPVLAAELMQRAREYEEDAEMVRRVLLHQRSAGPTGNAGDGEPDESEEIAPAQE